MRVGFASGDWTNPHLVGDGEERWGGSGWARIGQYLDKLPMFVCYGTLNWYDDRFVIRDTNGDLHDDLDVIVMQRLMHQGIVDNIPAAQAYGQKIVNDVDDWYWGLSPTNAAFTANHPKTNTGENTTFYRSIIARSDVVTVSTPYLADRLRGIVKGVIVIAPNTVELSKFTVRHHVDDGPPIVGWVGSTAHRSGDVDTLRGIIPPLFKSGAIRLHHSGDHPRHPSFASQLGIDDINITKLPLSHTSEYPSLMVMDIGLVPLNDIPFNRAKSSIKGLEYAAAGVPFIARYIDSYVQLHDELGVGRLAKRPNDWLKHLKALGSADARNEEALRNREAIQSCDIHFGAARLADVLTNL